VLGWAAGAVGFAALVRRTGEAGAVADRAFALAGLGGHLLSALLHSLLIDAHGGGPAGMVAVAVFGAAAAVSGRLAPRRRIALDAAALAALALATALALDGVALTLGLAGQALALAQLARRQHDRVARVGALAFAGLALGHALALDAPPVALIHGLDRPLAAAAGLLAAAVATRAAARAGAASHDPGAADDSRAARVVARALEIVAAATLLYLASTELVTFAGGAAQTALSILWAAVGVALLLAGLAGDRPHARRAALALLSLTAAKVFLYDLASLDSLARVGSLVGIGLLLLCGGFAWQRVRPRALPAAHAH
jgi:uncharacterized membrane protein